MDDVRAIQVSYPQIYLACHARHVRRRASPVRLSERDSSLLGHLSLEAPLSPGALARHLGIGQPALSPMLRRLERQGHLRTERPADDRRRLHLFLTPAGDLAMRQSALLDEARVAALLAQLRPAERQRAVEGLELLARAARELRTHQPRRGGTR